MPLKLKTIPGDDLRDWIIHPERVGEYLGAARNALGWSLREMELRSGVIHTEIFKIEKDQQECRLNSFVRLSAALGLPWGRVFDDLALCNDGVFHQAVRADAEFKVFATALKINTDRLFDDVAMQASAIVTFAAQLVRCDSALRKARQVIYPHADVELAFFDYAKRVDATDSLPVRLAILGGFNRNPVTELRRQSLWFEGLIATYCDYLQLPPTSRPKPSPYWLPWNDTLRFPDFTGKDAENGNTFNIYSETKPDDKEGVKPATASRWPNLRERTKALTAEHGAKARLADAFGVSRQVLNGWLSGASAPDAETTLRLLAWVTAEEAKTKTAGAQKPAPKKRPKK